VGFAFCLFQRKEGRGFGISIKKNKKKLKVRVIHRC
jgi:hypothetical protein